MAQGEGRFLLETPKVEKGLTTLRGKSPGFSVVAAGTEVPLKDQRGTCT